MIIPIHMAHHGELVPVGHAELDVFNQDELLELCNWVHYSMEKPHNLHSELCSCGHGVCFTNPETGQRHLALSFGWLVGDDDKILKYIHENQGEVVWVTHYEKK